VWLLGGVDVVSMRRSLDVLVRRHEALRTVFSTVDGEPVQVVLPEGAGGDGGWDVLEVLEEVGLEEVDRLVGGWAARPFGLAGGPAVLELPFDRGRPVVQSFRGGVVHEVIDAGLAERLRRLGRASGATLFMVLLGVFDVLLARLSGQTDIVVGVPVAGRSRV